MTTPDTQRDAELTEGGDDRDAAATATPPTAIEGRGQRRGRVLTKGDLLGRYVVIDRIGAGGMGVVYAGYDPDLNRKVALKLVRARSDSDGRHQARLMREAQALARLQHPNVVALHDVGSFGDQMFLAMELVDGQTASEWCKAGDRSWREIVAVFIAAGDGLAAAHGKQLVHRDFKPSNVLVGTDGRVRVTDFGLARGGHGEDVDVEWDEAERIAATPRTPVAPVGATVTPDHVSTDGKASGSSRDLLDQELTRAGSVMGTPAYMAPETYRGEAGAAADQFAFAVSLYEALYRQLPFDTKPRYDDDTRWVVRDVPRGGHVPRWLGEVIARGLARDPAARHASMTALVDALRRDPSRRRRGLVAVVVVAAVGASAWGVHRVQQARTLAACETEGERIALVWNPARADAIAAAFQATGLGYAADTWTRARARLDGYAATWRTTRTRVCARAELDETLTPELATASRTCLDEQRTGLDGLLAELAEPDATQVQKAATASASLPRVTLCTDAERLRHQVAPPSDPVLREQSDALRVRLARATAAEATGHYDQALAQAEDVLAEATKLSLAPLATAARIAVGHDQRRKGKFDDARGSFEAALFEAVAAGRDEVALWAAIGLVVVGNERAKHQEGLQWGRLGQSLVARLARSDDLAVADLLTSLAHIRRDLGEQAEAIALYERSLAIQETILGAEHPNVAGALANLASMHMRLGDLPKALALHERALVIFEATLGPDHPDVGGLLDHLGGVQQALGEADKAIPQHQRALAIFEKALGPGHPTVAMALYNLGNAYRETGELAKAGEVFERSMAIVEKALGPEHPHLAGVLTSLAGVQQARHEVAKAIAIYERALAIFEKVFGPDHSNVAMVLADLSTAYVEAGDVAKGIARAERAVATFEKNLGPDHPDLGRTLNKLASAYRARGEREKALPLQERALAILEKALGPEHPDVAIALALLGDLHHDRGERAKAIALYERVLAMRERGNAPAALLAGTRMKLAIVLWNGRGDRARAIELATAARDAYRSLGDSLGDAGTEMLGDANKWLANHARR